ncbi:GreA/GreB family elongation factor [Patescibacteria group bacterium]|nr:GreA/GreB family elongation factor [Patescibacteria group bacterium]
MTKNQLTQEGYDQLVAELKNLNQKSDQIINRIEEVAQPDESGEDSLASQLKAELEVINTKIADIEAVFENLEIITGKPSSSIVSVGSKVKVKISGNSEREFQIVSELEANPALNKISSLSPLGVAMVGHKVKDEFEVNAPVGKLKYKILSIN